MCNEPKDNPNPYCGRPCHRSRRLPFAPGEARRAKVVGEACDAASAYQCYKDTRPDVVIMDISMPGRGGIDAIEHIRELDAHARVLVFTMHSGAAYALQAFRAGAKGYVTKSSPPDLLVRAVRDIAEGRLAICPEISEALAVDRVQEEEDGTARTFTARVRDFPHGPGRKLTDEIASAFNLSRKTVANYHYAIKSKLGVDLILSCSISVFGKVWSNPFPP